VVTVLVEAEDDAAVTTALLDAHDPATGCVVVHPTSAVSSSSALARDVLMALGRPVGRLAAERISAAGPRSPPSSASHARPSTATSPDGAPPLTASERPLTPNEDQAMTLRREISRALRDSHALSGTSSLGIEEVAWHSGRSQSSSTRT
jgi:hypothetical protein